MKTSTIIMLLGWIMLTLDIFMGKLGTPERLAPVIVLCTALIIQAIEEK